jgi:hypothetical protein
MDTQEVITNMIDKIIAGDNTSAHEDFESLISNKMAAALDQRKQEVAQSFYGANEVDKNSDQETEVDETEQ